MQTVALITPRILKFMSSDNFLMRERIRSSSGTPGLGRWRSVTARIKESEMSKFQQRLKECGCKNMNQLLKQVLNGNVDKITEDEKNNRTPRRILSPLWHQHFHDELLKQLLNRSSPPRYAFSLYSRNNS